jgi:hypothetical protein
MSIKKRRKLRDKISFYQKFNIVFFFLTFAGVLAEYITNINIQECGFPTRIFTVSGVQVSNPHLQDFRSAGFQPAYSRFPNPQVKCHVSIF